MEKTKVWRSCRTNKEESEQNKVKRMRLADVARRGTYALAVFQMWFFFSFMKNVGDGSIQAAITRKPIWAKNTDEKC